VVTLGSNSNDQRIRLRGNSSSAVVRSLRNKSAGFTLLELLISIVIFSLVAAMAYSGLNNVLLARQLTEEKAEKLHKLQTAFSLISRDIEQTIDRPVRDNDGVAMPSLVGNQIGRYLLELTRTGWVNPLTMPRSNMLRVAYTLEDKKLIRAIWYVLDRPQDAEPYRMELLNDVTNLEFRYLDDKQKWHRSWPPMSSSSSLDPDEQAKQKAPAAVAVELETENFGKIERWFRVPG
jgi:general secretion pathway protein J